MATKLSRQLARGIWIPIPTAKDYVSSAMRTLGVVDVTCGYWLHDILCALFQWVPKSVWPSIATLVIAQPRKEK